MKLISTLFCFITILSCTQKNNNTYLSELEQNLIPAISVDGDTITNYDIIERMKHYNVPGLSLAITENGKLKAQKSYGVKVAGTDNLINENTKFQGASISKSITALGLLKLVNANQLDLDTDINNYLKTWKLPENKYTTHKKVTIRNLLTHTSGMRGINFLGYNANDTIPLTTKDILRGKGNHPKASLDTIPDSRFNYSGIGYVILQQLIEDLTKKSFEDYCREEVFIPLKMNHTTFTLKPADNFSYAHSKEGTVHPDKYKLFPASAPAGIWTTSSDLAKFTTAIENAYYGSTTAFVTPKLAKEMLANEDGYGLGIGVRGKDDKKFFFHGGSNPGGFKGVFSNFYKKRKGIIMLTNSENGNLLFEEMLRGFSKMEDLDALKQTIIKPLKIDIKEANAYIGKYQYLEKNNYFLELSLNDKNHFVFTDKNDGMIKEYIYTTDKEFVEQENGSKITFERDTLTNKVTKLNFENYTFYKVD